MNAKYFKRAGKTKHREDNYIFVVINSEDTWQPAKQFNFSVGVFQNVYSNFLKALGFLYSVVMCDSLAAGLSEKLVQTNQKVIPALHKKLS